MIVGFLGLGKLGLPVALAIESKGHKIIGLDISKVTIQNIKKKKLIIKRFGLINFYPKQN